MEGFFVGFGESNPPLESLHISQSLIVPVSQDFSLIKKTGYLRTLKEPGKQERDREIDKQPIT
jgi:hypothetical protein